MAKIEGWSRRRDLDAPLQNGTSVVWESDTISNMFLRVMPGDTAGWLVVLGRAGQGKPIRGLAATITKETATGAAIEWMRRHPNG